MMDKNATPTEQIEFATQHLRELAELFSKGRLLDSAAGSIEGYCRIIDRAVSYLREDGAA